MPKMDVLSEKGMVRRLTLARDTTIFTIFILTTTKQTPSNACLVPAEEISGALLPKKRTGSSRLSASHPRRRPRTAPREVVSEFFAPLGYHPLLAVDDASAAIHARWRRLLAARPNSHAHAPTRPQHRRPRLDGGAQRGAQQLQGLCRRRVLRRGEGDG